jgi:hypothetical protein
VRPFDVDGLVEALERAVRARRVSATAAQADGEIRPSACAEHSYPRVNRDPAVATAGAGASAPVARCSTNQSRAAVDEISNPRPTYCFARNGTEPSVLVGMGSGADYVVNALRGRIDALVTALEDFDQHGAAARAAVRVFPVAQTSTHPAGKTSAGGRREEQQALGGEAMAVRWRRPGARAADVS